MATGQQYRTTAPSAAPDRPTVGRRHGPTPVAPAATSRPVRLVHIGTLAASLAYWAVLDRNLWFFGDEWDFIARRGLVHPAVGIWVPHNEHWSTLPILLWRGLFNLVQLRSYWPYLLPVLAANLLVVHLLWRCCLRAGVDPWVATVGAAVVGLLGTGWEDLGWAFQIGFVGSLLFGLAAFQVADRPSTSVGRDLATGGLVLAALMCSTVGDATTAALAVYFLIRRSWWQALRSLVVPAAVAAWWWQAFGRRGLRTMGDSFSAKVWAGVPDFVWHQLCNVLGCGVPQVGAVVTTLLALWTLWRWRLLVRTPAPVALACGALAFDVLTALGRDRLGPGITTPSRYVYIDAVLLLPLLALALSSLAADWAAAGRPAIRPAHGRVLAVAILAVALAANVAEGIPTMASRTATVARDKRQILGSAELLAGGLHPIVRYPFPASGRYAGYLTPAAVLRLYRAGVLPSIGPLTATERAWDRTWLTVELTGRPAVPGRFRLVATTGVTVKWPAGRCATLRPIPSGQPQHGAGPLPTPAVLLAPSTRRSAAVRVRSGPGAQLVVLLRRGSPRRSLPAGAVNGKPLQLGGQGTGVLDDAAGGAELIVDLPAGGSTSLCGLVR